MKNKVSSILLYEDQIARLNRRKSIGAKIIKTAIYRFERGDFQLAPIRSAPCAIFPIRKDFKYDSCTLRRIIDAHYSKPLDWSSEINKLDKLIDAQIKYYSKKKTIDAGELEE